jgi:hypothetical protein
LKALRFFHGQRLHEETLPEKRGGVNYIIAEGFN